MLVVFCLPGRSFSGKFLLAWSNLLIYCLSNGINTVISQRYNSNVYYVRPQCLGAGVLRGKHQAPFDRKINYDYIMWIDSDMVFTPKHFQQLLRHGDKDIVSGMYLMDGGEEYAVVKDWNIDYFKQHATFQFLKKDAPEISEGKLFKASYAGMGFMLVKRGVFETIEYPWFEPEFFYLNEDIKDFCSEDVGFCRKAAKTGFDIWVDPNIIVGHEKSIVY